MTHPFSNKGYEEERYSVRDVALKVGVAVSTIYRYIQSSSIPFHQDIEGHYYFNKEEIEVIRKELVIHTTGSSLSQLASELNIPRQRLLKELNEANIHVPKVTIGKREQYIISDELSLKIKEHVNSKLALQRSQFYSRKHNICLHQAFKSRVSDTMYRIVLEGGIWGVRTPMGIMPFEQAKRELQLLPLYDIKAKNKRTTRYTKLSINLSDPHFFTLIDNLYATCGISNLKFHYEDDYLLVDVREGRYLTWQDNTPGLISSYCVEGSVLYVQDHILFKSEEIVVKLNLQPEEYEKLLQQAQSVQMTLEEYIINKLIKG